MAKILKRDVDTACARYANDLSRWGEGNMATQRSFQRYWELRTAWETQTGKSYVKLRG